MKKLLILFLLLVMPLVYARSVDVDLYKNDSYMKDGINITLMNIDKEKNKFIICANGENYIVTESGISREHFTIKVDNIKKDKVELNIDIDCKDCKCEGYCNNKRCFPNPKYVYETKEEQKEEDVIEEINVGNYTLIVFMIIFVIVLFVAYYVIKKKI